MLETRHGLKVSLQVPYHDVVSRATAALKVQGFGVLTTIDIQQTLKAKLSRDFRKYVILGACNPPLADRALHTELEVGLLLPGNVIVYEVSPTESVVAAMAPLAALSLATGDVGCDNGLADHRRERQIAAIASNAVGFRLYDRNGSCLSQRALHRHERCRRRVASLRRVGIWLYGPRFWNVDLGVAKRFRAGSASVGIEVLFLDLFNTTNFLVGAQSNDLGVNANINSTTSGQTDVDDLDGGRSAEPAAAVHRELVGANGAWAQPPRH